MTDLIAEAEREPNTAISFDKHDEPLSVFLQNIVRQIKKRHDKINPTNILVGSRHRTILLRNLENEAKAINCTKCAEDHADGKVCQNKWIDDEILAKDAQCMRFVTTLFEF